MPTLAAHLDELIMAVFTTLAPSGALSFVLVAAVILWAPFATPAWRNRLEKLLVVPLAAVMCGLVVSATHLGNPANALYLFRRVGASPLSTEIFCAVLFLLLAGVYWLYSFSLNPRRVLKKAWLVLAIAAAFAFEAAMVFAYSTHTILSWNSPWAAASLAGAAVGASPLLALLTLCLAGLRGGEWRWLTRALVLISAVGCVLCVVLLVVFGIELTGMRNGIESGAELAELHWLGLTGYVLLSSAAIVLTILGALKYQKRQLLLMALAVALALLGVFVARLAFYSVHMTVGL